MKINEFTHTGNQSQSKSPPSSEYFIGLLELSPTATGDEFYWQHQNQLQKSELEFNRPNSSTPSPKKIKTNEENLNDSSNSENHHATTQTSFLNLAKPTNKKEEVNGSIENLELSNSKIATHTSLFSLAIMNQEIAAFDDYLKEVNQEVNSSNPYLNIHKKYHLFVEQGNAELTINAEDLKRHEKKTVFQIIKTYLKEKGFALKKLTINGVSHD